MLWTGLGCLGLGINSIVWRDNAINWAPVYGDIWTKFFVGLIIAIPAASLCINRRLYHIASVRTVTNSKADKRRAVMVDLAIGLGIPVIYMALHYIVQGHRFDIFEGVGPWHSIYLTTLAVFLVVMPPMMVGLTSAVYSVLAIRAFAKTRSQFNEFLSGNNYRNLTSSRYLRLMALAGTDVCCTVPLQIFQFYTSVSGVGVRPWKGWHETHVGFSRVDAYPKIIWQHYRNYVNPIESTRWIIVGCAFMFFAYFGFADEAFKNYRSAIRTVSKTVGISVHTDTEDTFGAYGSRSKGFGASSGGKFSSFKRSGAKRADSITSLSSSIDEKDAAQKAKKGGFDPDLSFGELSLADAGGVLSDYSPSPSDSHSSFPSPVLPTSPTPAVTRPPSGIDIDTVPRSASPTFLTVPLPTKPGHPEKANTVDMV
jgi:pheromone a factor receptor